MRRVIALLQAVWLALLIAEPAALHACEMHASGHSTHDAPVVAGASVHHSGHEHAIHDDASAVPEDAGAAVCQCLGSCCAAATAALVPTPEVPAVARIAATAVSVPVRAGVAARATDLRLPFANGPPETLTT